MDDVPTTVYTIANDTVSGASEIAQRAAHELASLPRRTAMEACQVLLEGHPSMGPLWRLATYVMDAGTPSGGADKFLAEFAKDANIAEVVAGSLFGYVMTISWSSNVVEALRIARPKRVLCMESEPGSEGARTAHALSDLMEAVVIPDEEALAGPRAGCIVVGADAVTPEFLVNKVKTRALAESANERNVPVYSVAGAAKFVAPSVRVVEPFEAVPLELFTGIAVPGRLLKGTQARAVAQSYPVHRDLLPILRVAG